MRMLEILLYTKINPTKPFAFMLRSDPEIITDGQSLNDYVTTQQLKVGLIEPTQPPLWNHNTLAVGDTRPRIISKIIELWLADLGCEPQTLEYYSKLAQKQIVWEAQNLDPTWTRITIRRPRKRRWLVCFRWWATASADGMHDP